MTNKIIYVFLIAGQSNAVGHSADPSNGPLIPAGTALQYYSGSLSESGGDPVGEATSGSAWPSFALTYAMASGGMICLIPAAANGSAQVAAATVSGFDNWDTSGTLYSTSILLWNSALTALSAAGYQPIVKGIIWCQGETDASAIDALAIGAANYKSALIAMIARFRTVPIGATLYPELPFYISTTGGPSSGDTLGHQQVRIAQREVAASDFYTHIVFDNAISFIARGFMQSGNKHYIQVGYNEMGSQIAINILGGISVSRFAVPLTPYLTIGGATTGIAYSVQMGDCIQDKDRIYFSGRIVLTSKGSLTGTVLINGFPVSRNVTNLITAISLTGNFMGGSVNCLQAVVGSNSTFISPSNLAAGAITALNETHLTNTTAMNFSGNYPI